MRAAGAKAVIYIFLQVKYFHRSPSQAGEGETVTFPQPAGGARAFGRERLGIVPQQLSSAGFSNISISPDRIGASGVAEWSAQDLAFSYRGVGTYPLNLNGLRVNRSAARGAGWDRKDLPALAPSHRCPSVAVRGECRPEQLDEPDGMVVPNAARAIRCLCCFGAGVISP